MRRAQVRKGRPNVVHPSSSLCGQFNHKWQHKACKACSMALAKETPCLHSRLETLQVFFFCPIAFHITDFEAVSQHVPSAPLLVVFADGPYLAAPYGCTLRDAHNWKACLKVTRCLNPKCNWVCCPWPVAGLGASTKMLPGQHLSLDLATKQRPTQQRQKDTTQTTRNTKATAAHERNRHAHTHTCKGRISTRDKRTQRRTNGAQKGQQQLTDNGAAGARQPAHPAKKGSVKEGRPKNIGHRTKQTASGKHRTNEMLTKRSPVRRQKGKTVPQRTHQNHHRHTR